MKLIIISLMLGILFAFNKAELYNFNFSINEKNRDKRSVSEGLLINLSGISEIKITSKSSADGGLKATCNANGENLSYKWHAKIGDLLSNEIAEGNVLSINPITKKNDREFCCEVSNIAETIEKCKRLGPLLISSDPLERIIDSSAEMFCEVFGLDFNIDIKWQRAEGLPKNAIVNDTFLTIPKLARTDTGNYTCIGWWNGRTIFSKKIPLKVVAPPEIVELRNTGLDSEYDNNVTIQCITQPDETITYTWKTHTEGHTDMRENEKAEGDLLSIYNFKKDNEGTFCCIATNALGIREKCMTIKSPILEVYPKESQEVISGSSVTLECRESTGSLDMKIDWARGDGKQFSSNVIKLDNGTLIIKNIAIEDEGHYDCSATKGVLSTSATTVIKVKTLPVVTIIPSDNGNLTSKLEDEVILTCTADGHPQPNVQWQKFSTETQSYQTVKPATLESTVYEIRSLSEKDAGLYLCLAENSVGSTKKTVEVGIKPLVLEVYPKKPDTVMSGSSVTLECRESTGYSNVKIDWARRDGKQFSSNVIKLANGTLIIKNIAIEDEGHYDCSATKGVLSTSATTVIKVKTFPVVTIIPSNNGNITAKLEDKVILICAAAGHPEPNVQWQKFSTETQSYQTVKPATLESIVYEIRSLSKKEAGLYRCLAENSAGSTIETVEVGIKPLVLEVYPKNLDKVILRSSVTLECRESTGYSNVKIVWAREDGQEFASNFIKLANGSLGITNITINDSGRYKCSATKGVLSGSTTADISVRIPPPSLISIKREPEVSSHRMICSATGDNLSYRWAPEYGNFLSNEIAEGNVLTFNNLTLENYRFFCCNVSNIAGSLRYCRNLAETVQSTGCTARVGTTAELSSKVYGPYPEEHSIDWSRENGLPLPKNAIKVDHRLIIPQVALTDAGKYWAYIIYRRSGFSFGGWYPSVLTVVPA